jgi:hypothetical protein
VKFRSLEDSNNDRFESLEFICEAEGFLERARNLTSHRLHGINATRHGFW